MAISTIHHYHHQYLVSVFVLLSILTVDGKEEKENKQKYTGLL